MVGELGAGNPHVQFDEGVQKMCDSATRLCSTPPKPLAFRVGQNHSRPHFGAFFSPSPDAGSATDDVGGGSGTAGRPATD
jgi:hypothetical protein